LTAFPGSCLWNFPENLGMRILNRDFKFFQAWKEDKPMINCDSKELPKNVLIRQWKDLIEEWRRFKKNE
jgi:hypothetical protein